MLLPLQSGDRRVSRIGSLVNNHKRDKMNSMKLSRVVVTAVMGVSLLSVPALSASSTRTSVRSVAGRTHCQKIVKAIQARSKSGGSFEANRDKLKRRLDKLETAKWKPMANSVRILKTTDSTRKLTGEIDGFHDEYTKRIASSGLDISNASPEEYSYLDAKNVTLAAYTTAATTTRKFAVQTTVYNCDHPAQVNEALKVVKFQQNIIYRTNRKLKQKASAVNNSRHALRLEINKCVRERRCAKVRS